MKNLGKKCFMEIKSATLCMTISAMNSKNPIWILSNVLIQYCRIAPFEYEINQADQKWIFNCVLINRTFVNGLLKHAQFSYSRIETIKKVHPRIIFTFFICITYCQPNCIHYNFASDSHSKFVHIHTWQNVCQCARGARGGCHFSCIIHYDCHLLPMHRVIARHDLAIAAAAATIARYRIACARTVNEQLPSTRHRQRIQNASHRTPSLSGRTLLIYYDRESQHTICVCTL